MLKQILPAALSAILVLAVAGAALASSALAQEAPAPQLPQTPEAWRSAAIADLDAARDLLRTQTPIPYDTENQHYALWLEEGFAQARVLAEQAHDIHSYYFSLLRFSNGFRDPHINIGATIQLPRPGWPGFVAGARNGGAVVTWRDDTDPDAPQIGEQIASCDGQPLNVLTEQRIFPYVLNSQIALDRRRAISRLFLDRNLPNAPVPTRCTFVTSEGERERMLRWRPVPEDQQQFSAAYQNASYGPSATWGVTEVEPGVFWIGVPTFNSGDTAAQLEALMTEIEARAQTIRNARAIVIDVRGNGGGNSAWADRLARAVFGARAVERVQRRTSQPSATDWRASPENVAYWREWMNTVAIPEFGENSDTARFGRDAIAGMEAAIARGEPLWRQGSPVVGQSGGLTQRRPRRGRSPVAAQVYLLSNGTCGSSCLNFADTVLHIPGVKLIGSATSGDGHYMEVRGERLPSGLASLTFPQKVWRGMGRGALEAYQPDIAYDGAWDDASVRAWVMGLIAAQ
ncbi:MAG: hypothetical protein K2X34_01190 [Hyphomonadaceae bacterium]|nr:hypothetical protein [Hyphomonadaceae bacterium]